MKINFKGKGFTATKTGIYWKQKAYPYDNVYGDWFGFVIQLFSYRWYVILSGKFKVTV